MSTRARGISATPTAKDTFKYTYQKDQLIALTSTKQGDLPKIYRVVEDMRTNDLRGRMKVIQLKKVKNAKETVVFEEDIEILLPVNSQIVELKQVELKKPHQKNAKMQFTLKNDILSEISKQIQAKPIENKKTAKETPQLKPQKMQVKESSDSEDEELVANILPKAEQQEENEDQDEDQEEDEEEVKLAKNSKAINKGSKKLPPLQISAPKARRLSNGKNKQAEHSEDQEEIQEKIKVNIKAPYVRKSRAKVRKVINYEESSQQKSDTEVSDMEKSEQSIKKNSKKGGKKSSKLPNKFVKGKFNPNIEKVISHNNQLEGTENDMLPLQSIKLNNKELIRAAYTGNLKLLDNILKSKNKISSFFERWAPERDFNAIEILFERDNKAMLQKLLAAMGKQNKLKLTNTPACSMKEINTGFNDKYAYGVRTRVVNLSRGGREGNNALVQDILIQSDVWSNYMFDRLLETQSNPVFFNYLKSHIKSHEINQLQARVPVAVRSGNYEVAGFLIQQMLKQGGQYGYNIVHAQVLTLKNTSTMGEIKKPSALKKNVGQMLITPVHCAAINPNPEFLRILLDISGELSIMDELMRKPVHYAATSQGTGTLKLLLERGIDPREGDREKNTPLILASKFGRVHNIEVLISQTSFTQQQLNFKNKHGNAAIHVAAEGGHVECLKALIVGGAYLHLTGKNRMTALNIASAYGHFDCVEYLIQAGSKILTKDKMSRSSLLMAVRNGNIDIASLLLMKGAEFNGTDSSKNSCVHYAAAYGWSDCIDLLIKAGANQNAKNSWNLTPLSVALQKNLFGIVKCLLNYESTDVNCKDDEGRTLVSSSLSKFTADSFEYIKFLIVEKNADIKIPDLNGLSPLHYAAQLNPSDVNSFYADFEQKTNEEKKEIIDSYRELIFSLIEILIQKGADINAQDNQGVTPFMTAIKAKNFSIANKFISLQAPNTQLYDSQDQNILHLMAYEQSFFHEEGMILIKNLFQDLKNKKEMLSAVDANGYTPLLILANQFAQGVKSQFGVMLFELEQKEFIVKFHEKLAELKKNKPKKVTKKRYPKKTVSVEEEEDNDEDQQGEEDHSDDEEDGEDHLVNEGQQNLIHNNKDDEDEKEDYSGSSLQAKQFGSSVAQPFQFGGAFNPSQQFGGAFPSQQFGGLPLASPYPTQSLLFGGQAFNGNNFGMIDGPQPTFGLPIQGNGIVKQFKKSQTFTVNNQAIIVGLTLSEHKVLIQQAQEKFDDLEIEFFHLIQSFLKEGADGKATVIRLKKYRQQIDKDFQVKEKMLEEQANKIIEDKGLRGGARTYQTARKSAGMKGLRATAGFGQANELQNEKDKYNVHGKQSIIHFLFKYYPNQRTVEQILKLVDLDYNAKDYKGRSPIVLFAETASNSFLINSNEEPYANQLTFLRYALKKLQVNIHQSDQQKNTPASILAIRGQFDLMNEICLAGGNPNNLNKKNQVPLIHWVKQSNLENIAKLIDLGCDPNFTDKNKRSALHHAVNGSNSSADASFELEQLLLINGARADIQDVQLRTPLFYAFVKIGKHDDRSEIDPFETVSSLCALPDCDVNFVDKFKRTPLHYAAQRGAVISGRYLMKLNAVVDTWDGDNNTPMGIAFINGHSNFSTMMIDNKADVSQEANVVDPALKVGQKKLKKQPPVALPTIAVEEFVYEESSDEDEQGGENQDKDDDVQSVSEDKEQASYQQQQYRQKENFGFFGQLNPYGQQQQPSKGAFLPGKYSFFMLAIKHGWQGVAYLLIQDGFDLQKAIEDALNADQFKLVKTLLFKVKDNTLITKLNSEKQNLFHILAKKGNNANTLEATQLIQEMLRRGIDCTSHDLYQKSPLHYACQHNFVILQNLLLQKGCDPNQVDQDHKTPFSLGLEHHYDSFINQTRLSLFISNSLDLNKQFKINDKLHNILLFLISEKNITDELIYHFLIDNGADCNSLDQKHMGVLSHSIIINSVRLVKFFLNHPKLNKEIQLHDKDGITPVHYVVQPLSFGSYENTELLRILIEHGMNINDRDKHGKTPLDYANLQESGVMKNELLKHKAISSNPAGQVQQIMLTQFIADANWPEEEVDFETDSTRYLEIKENQEKSKKNFMKDEGQPTEKEHICKVDQYCVQQGGRYEVVEDPQIGPYSLIMTKVDIKNGHYSENVYYRMQVLHESNRNVFLLFTRWGRIGTPGQFQMTPFESQEVTIKEFSKIFSQKASNDWRKVNSGEVQFEKQKGKYQLMNVGRHVNYQQFLEPFDHSERSPYPACNLEASIKYILKQFTQVKLYSQVIQELNIDSEAMPLERLNKSQLIKAKSYLNEIHDLIGELEDVRKKKDPADIDIEQVLRISEIIANKSSRYYELIPHRDFKNEPIPPIDNLNILFQKFTVIETLLQFEVTSKILLGAHLMKQTLNPLNYCFNALNMRMMCLPRDHPEFGLIKSYVTRSHPHKEDFIKNIFAIERRGESERFEAWKKVGNRQLLWHGSKVSNFMGILAQGLKVAPPWAINSGTMFGKGVYFADMFEKSWGYTNDYSFQFNVYNGTYQQGQGHSYSEDMNELGKNRYMLLCEVALGKSKNLTQSENIEQLPTHFQSVKAMGQSGPNPDQKLILQNGCQVPIGKIITYEQKPQQMACLGHNEFIIYDETQVRVRYLLQCSSS